MSDFVLHHISHSAANKYLTCGERFRLERVERHRGRPHLASIGGSAFHSWSEEYDNLTAWGVTAPVETMPTFQTFFDAEMVNTLEDHYRRTDEELGPDQITCSKGEGIDWWERKGPDMCEAYIQWRQSTGWQVDVVEYQYEQELGLSVPALGYIDREFIDAEGRRILVDIKTGKKIYKNPQLFEYAVIRRLQGVVVDLVAYYDARKGILTEPVDPTQHTVSWLRQYYGSVVNKIHAGIFEPNPGAQCNWCPVRDVCAYNPKRNG